MAIIRQSNFSISPPYPAVFSIKNQIALNNVLEKWNKKTEMILTARKTTIISTLIFLFDTSKNLLILMKI
ncbi:hypothetical protein BKG93_10970 [Rodentibacter ratti]|uniref:Uncharacterized protein n=1 Tax=Rodentibacter ratti TaxID=1906745 RepID=A0A1V3KZX9_9PAST|nr:hypothetical protein BKG93_10970 [Rodentibacter ratti]